jgi:hypothetical protein
MASRCNSGLQVRENARGGADASGTFCAKEGAVGNRAGEQYRTFRKQTRLASPDMLAQIPSIAKFIVSLDQLDALAAS